MTRTRPHSDAGGGHGGPVCWAARLLRVSCRTSRWTELTERSGQWLAFLPLSRWVTALATADREGLAMIAQGVFQRLSDAGHRPENLTGEDLSAYPDPVALRGGLGTEVLL